MNNYGMSWKQEKEAYEKYQKCLNLGLMPVFLGNPQKGELPCFYIKEGSEESMIKRAYDRAIELGYFEGEEGRGKFELEAALSTHEGHDCIVLMF